MGLMPPGVTIGHLNEFKGRQFTFDSLFNEKAPESAVSALFVRVECGRTVDAVCKDGSN